MTQFLALHSFEFPIEGTVSAVSFFFAKKGGQGDADFSAPRRAISIPARVPAGAEGSIGLGKSYAESPIATHRANRYGVCNGVGSEIEANKTHGTSPLNFPFGFSRLS